MARLAIVNEADGDETRVALTPDAIRRLERRGLAVAIEAGSGVAAGYADSEYEEAGAAVCSNADEALRGADVAAFVLTPTAAHRAAMDAGTLVFGMFKPLTDFDQVIACGDARLMTLSYDFVPRISRAQGVDVLSAMANLAGYKAVLLGAAHLPRMVPMMMTAAGTIRASKVFVIGAGVAGLQAIATAKRLGAIVDAYDVRSTVKEQIESLGGKFVEFEVAAKEGEGGYAGAQSESEQESQRRQMKAVVAQAQLVVTTAAIPGRPAPKLIDESMVQAMQPGSVIVDLAAESGGNCTLCQPGETIVAHGVSIIGHRNLARTIPFHASQMLGKIVTGLVEMVVTKDGVVEAPLDDEIIGAMTITRAGNIVAPRVREAMGLGPLSEEPVSEEAAT